MRKHVFADGTSGSMATVTGLARLTPPRIPFIARATRTKTKEARKREAVDVTWIPGTKDREIERTKQAGGPSQQPRPVGIIDAAARDLNPSYFAGVMATGIVSIAAKLSGMETIGWTLFRLNAVFFGILCFLTLIRVARHFPRIVQDFTSHARGAGFFTLVPATCVLGTQFMVFLEGSSLGTRYGLLLWIAGILLWLLLMYTFIPVMTIQHVSSTLETGINGAWLLAVVATQGISVLGASVAPLLPWEDGIQFLNLAMFLAGCMLYVMIITLIFYRLTFLGLTPEMFTPPYWINMGAVAITTLAGSTLILNASHWAFFQEILPFLKGFTLFFWAIGTWWIPVLVVVFGWRHLYKRVPLRYDPQYWGMVFPLGMYTVCTYKLTAAIGLPFLATIPHIFVYFALIAWSATFLGLLHRVANSVYVSYLTPAPSRK